jgi:hypothetical protein
MQTSFQEARLHEIPQLDVVHVSGSGTRPDGETHPQ